MKVEVSKLAAGRGVTVATAGQQLAGAIATTLGPVQRKRVEDRGDLAGQAFPGYSQKGLVAVSPRYPVTGGHVGPSGARWFRSSQEMHAAAGKRPGSYSVSGGMWDGLSAVVETPTRSSILFRGRSEGQGPNFFRSRAKGSKAGPRARGLKVNNALKAATILTMHKVNVLALSEGEFQSVGRASVYALALGASGDLPIEWNGWRPPATVPDAVRMAFA